MTAAVVPALFCAGAGLALLCGLSPKGRPLWALLAAACTGLGVLSGLALGWGLDGLLAPVLAVCAAAMAALRFGRGGDG